MPGGGLILPEASPSSVGNQSCALAVVSTSVARQPMRAIDILPMAGAVIVSHGGRVDRGSAAEPRRRRDGREVGAAGWLHLYSGPG